MAQETPQSRSLLSAGGLVLILVILVLINIIVSQLNLRWDATADNLYSLSEGSKEIIDNLKNPVTLKVFYSQDNPNLPVHIKTYGRRMLDFLQEYEKESNGRVRVEVYNPEPDSEAEEWARKYGIEGINLASGQTLYFGVVAVSADQEEAIPSLDPSREPHLEYDITRIISRVQSPKKKTIGVLTALPMFGGPPPGMMPQRGSEPWLVISELRKNYTVEQIELEAERLPPDLDLLIMVHPRGISKPLQYAVDQYLLSGGNLLAFLDPQCTGDRGQGFVPEKLLDAWGLEMDTGKLVSDFDYATKLRNQQNQVESHPLWLSIPADGINREAIVTADLESLLMPMAGALKTVENSEYSPEVLVESSSNSALEPGFKARMGTTQLRRDFQATPEQYALAVKIQGKFATAFPDGKPESTDPEQAESGDEAGESKGADHLSQAETAATLVVVGDADMLMDDFYVRRQNFLGFNMAQIFNDNLNFFLNSAEMLTGNDALISIRSRGTFERPFTRVEELERKAQNRWREREQELMARAEETNQKLQQLEQQKQSSQKLVLSAEQEAEIERFREEKLRINQELKKVRRKLRADIEALGTKVKFANIFLMPLLVCIAGLGYALYRRQKTS